MVISSPEPWLSIEEAPQYGDIVWSLFPYEGIVGPGQKFRPALVLATSVFASKKPPYATVQCAYGTSKLKHDHPATKLHLRIENVYSLNQFRLPQATRFDLDRIAWIPWSRRFFQPRQGQSTPIIGKLNKEYLRKLETLKVVRAYKDSDDC